MARLVLDLETASTADLRKTGAQAYAEHPDTRITVLCFAVDDNPVYTWISGPPPALFLVALMAGATVVAHNYLFEFNLYHQKLVPRGWPPIPLSRWSCTMARALVAGYPASLELVGKALGLSPSQQKDTAGRDLMLRFARPRSLNPLTWWHETDPARYAALADYCAQDVIAERWVDRAIPELSPRERAIFEIDFHINQRGLGVDHALVGQLAALTREAQDQLSRDIVRLTNGQIVSLNQVAQLRAWLGFQGVDMPDLRRATVQAKLLDHTLTGAPRQVLQARLDASRSSTAKLAAVVAARSRDGRLRGTFQYYGAGRTGRWAGRRFQPQNLFRGSIKDVAGALRLIRAGISPADLEMLCEDSALGVVASCLRSTIVARSGYRLVIADLSQIEARVLAWLAGQADALAVFASGEDIYMATARSLGSSNRMLGKICVLALGFAMGPSRFIDTARSFGVTLTAADAETTVRAWRVANRRIVDFWWAVHRALLHVVKGGPGTAARVGRCVFIRQRTALLIRLPSARHLVYRDPRIETNGSNFEEFTYMGSLGGNWTRLRAWPGKIAENITQAVARDVMVDAMLTLDDEPMIATVHDELVAEVSAVAADATLARMLGTMRTPPLWAPGLPVDAAGFIVQRYQKG